jgi:D-alanyl-lipoteichoic acid acyltransferase DltB (MBOAT superfamily)
MSITSFVFIIFCAASILVYWRLPQRYRIPWLFTISMVFILTWSWNLAGILLVVATVNFFLGRWLWIASSTPSPGINPGKSPATAKNSRRILLWLGIGFNVLALVALKYSDFYVTALTRLLGKMGVHTAAGGLLLLVPIGLSFIAVQMISYLVDVHNRILKPEAHWLDFALYVVYFPKMLSGPVERARTILPMFKQPKAPDAQAAERNFWLIVIGVVRKIVLADSLLSIIPAAIFQHPETFAGQDLIVYLLAYAFVIYNDFAGYTSIVRGVSGFFGIELTNNFKLPYFSRSISEFWERWHVSLSNWLRDYIFFPTSRALLKKIPKRDQIINLVVPPFATMLVSGMWHGIGWNFLVWGGLHGFYLFIERVSTLWSPRRLLNELPKWRQVLSALGIFVLVVLAWIPFRMELAIAWQYLVRILTPSDWIKPNFWLLRMYLIGKTQVNSWTEFNLPDIRVFILLIPALLLDWKQSQHKDETFFTKWPVWGKALFLAVLILVVVLLAFAETGTPFIYQGF